MHNTRWKKRQMKKLTFMFAVMLTVLALPGMTVFAAETGTEFPIVGRINELTGLVCGILSAAGGIFTVWGIAEWGTAYQSTDGTMQTHAVKRIIGGLLWVFAPQISNIIIG